MHQTVAERQGDIVRGENNLLYYSVFGEGYYKLLKMSLASIDKTASSKSFDVLIITDTATKRRIASSSFAKKFNMHYMLVDTPEDGVEASKTKCKIFEWEKINDYNKILFLDVDIIAFKDVCQIFNETYESGYLYTVHNKNMNYEVAFNSKYYSVTRATNEELSHYKSNNQMPFNAGQFLFVNSIKMQQHFTNIQWFMQNWPGEYFFEQSFMVQYFCRNLLTKTDILQKYVTVHIITPSIYDPVSDTSITTLIHFAGAALNSAAKIDYITTYIDTNANLI